MNSLEIYCFTVRAALHEAMLKGKSEGGDAEQVEAAVVQEALYWLDHYHLAAKDEPDAKQQGDTKGDSNAAVHDLENYCIKMRNTLLEAKPKDKFEDGDMEIETA